MIRTLDRLIVGSFLKIFLGFIVGAPVLFLVGHLVENVDRYFDRGLGVGEVALAYVYKVPQFVFWSLGVASLLAAVFTIHSMTVHREILAAKAGGISFRRLTVPLLALGVLVTGLAVWLSDVVPVGERRANQILGQVDLSRQWRSDFVFQTDEGGTLSVRRLTVSDQKMSNIVFEMPLRESGAMRHLLAEEARFEESLGWTFHDGYVRVLRSDGTQLTHRFDSLRTAGFSERPEDLLDQATLEKEMTASELARLARNIERSGGDSSKLRLERQQRLALALAGLVIILFGSPLATSSRRGGTAFGLGIALGTTLAYMLLMRVTGALGETGALEPSLAAWIPNGIFALCGLILLRRVRT